MTYDYTDIVIRHLDTQYVRRFLKLKAEVTKANFDELNVIQAVNDFAEDIIVLTKKAYVNLANNVYLKNSKTGSREIDADWVEWYLDNYDETTKYVFNNEVERKTSRLVELILSDRDNRGNLSADVKSALRNWSQMQREYAVRITDGAVDQAMIDDGITKAMWVSEKDSRVCGICDARDGKIYPIADFPAKPHWGCRCRRKPV